MRRWACRFRHPLRAAYARVPAGVASAGRPSSHAAADHVVRIALELLQHQPRHGRRHCHVRPRAVPGDRLLRPRADRAMR